MTKVEDSLKNWGNCLIARDKVLPSANSFHRKPVLALTGSTTVIQKLDRIRNRHATTMKFMQSFQKLQSDLLAFGAPKSLTVSETIGLGR